jgi:predicted phage terminase large subunit-like protein
MADEYVHLSLPMEFEVARRCETKIGFRDPRTKECELLDPVRFPLEVVDDLRVGMGSHAFAGQYQQRPSAREGGMFKRHWFQIVDAIPADARNKVRRWDLAASLAESGTDPDWTVGVKMSTGALGSDAAGKFYIENVVRFRETGATVRRTIKTMAACDGRSCRIVIPQDPGQAGKDQAASIIGENAGFRIEAERETGDKGTRAEPLAAQCEAGNVYLVRADWNEAFIDELCGFPKGHDDMVDAASGAFTKLAAAKRPIIFSNELLTGIAAAGARRF